MLKKIFITFFILILSLFFQTKVFSATVPVENIFSDISRDYKYYNELQYLYDKGMIFPDEDGRFNPNKLLNRDEFVGIMMEVSCTSCISPNTSYDLINKYGTTTNLFFDLNNTNKNFYCIASAKDSGFVKGYDTGTRCEDGSGIDGEIPFCPNNTIILEEAIAVILRASGILTNNEADRIRFEIASGNITQSLSDDVGPFNLDGSVYSFYPDFQKALNYEVVEYDNFGNERVYKLVEKVNNRLNPKQAISKEKFLLIAYVALKSNSCSRLQEANLGLEMKIFDKSCNGNISSCRLSDLRGNEKIFDFYSNEGLYFGDTISNQNSYIWRFYNYNTGEEIKRYGKFIDNYDFQNDGKYRVYLRVITDRGNTAEVYNDINISSSNTVNSDLTNKKISIEANPISGNFPLVVDFKSIVSDRSDIKSYTWNYGDGSIGYGSNSSHIYREPGVYEVQLNIVDNSNNIYSSTVVINVFNPRDIINEINSGNNTGDNSGSNIGDNSGNNTGISIGNNFNPSDFLCNEQDILNGLYGCTSEEMLGQYSQERANALIGDSDGDGVNDLDDLCPFLPGPASNKGCPIINDICSNDSDCKNGYFCNSGSCSPRPFTIGCEYSGGDLIYGNAVCNSCPCNNYVDFNSILRRCDIVFPAITSSNQEIIFSRGNYFPVR